MNERIQELAKGAKHAVEQEGILLELVLEKFAKLIVRECAKVAFDDWCEGTNEESSQMTILKHFGVEE